MELCIIPEDKEIAETAISEIYRILGLQKPKFKWFANPLEVHFQHESESIKDLVVENILPEAKPLKALYKSLIECIGKELEAKTNSQEYLNFFLFGQHESYLNKYSEHKKVLDDLCRNLNWYAPFKTVCMMVEKPIKQTVLNYLTHDYVDAAIIYKNNFKVFAIKGVNVPKNLIESPDYQDLDEIDDEQDPIIKRIRIEIFAGHNTTTLEGYEKYLKFKRYNVSKPFEKDGKKFILCKISKTKSRLLIHDEQSNHTNMVALDKSVDTIEKAVGVQSECLIF
jgi:hypothetical protein